LDVLKWIAMAVLALSLLPAAGCNRHDDLDARFMACRDLVADKETQEESLDCWTAESRRILANLLEEAHSSSGVLHYAGNYRRLLDFDEAVGAPEVHENIALLPVKKGRRQATIVFVRDEDEWRIDARELPGFWSPMDDLLEVQ